MYSNVLLRQTVNDYTKCGSPFGSKIGKSSRISDAKQWTGGRNIKCIKMPQHTQRPESKRGIVTCATHLFIGLRSASVHYKVSLKNIVSLTLYSFVPNYYLVLLQGNFSMRWKEWRPLTSWHGRSTNASIPNMIRPTLPMNENSCWFVLLLVVIYCLAGLLLMAKTSFGVDLTIALF